MAGFNMDDFLAGASRTGASQASGGFDMDSFLATPRASDERRGGAEEDEDYGWWERQRDTVLAETGNETVANSGWAGFAANVVPFVASQMKKHRDKRLQALEALRTGEGPRDEQPAAQGEGGDEVQGIVADALSGIDPALLARNESADAASGRKGWDALRRFAVDEAELDEKAVDALYGAAKTPEDFANSLRGLAEGEIKNIVKRRKDAAARLNVNKSDWIDSVVNGLLTNAGYTGQYIVASAVPFGLGYAGLVGDAAHQRYLELTTKDYDVDDDGNLVVIHNEDRGGAGTAAKAVLGGAAEVAVEQSLEKLLGAAGRGLVKIPGVGKAAGAVGKTVSSTAGKAANATARTLSKNPAGKWLVGAARGFGKYSETTGVHGMPMEMLEEHVQAFADDVLGLGKKDREQKGLADEASDWWHNKFWNAENNKEIFLGLVGTMAVQGAYAGTAAHAEAKKWRRNPAGYLKMMIDEKTVDALSDEEVAHLYRFVTSDGFTEKNVNRFLGHVKQRVDLSNALLQLRDAAAPFFGKNDQKAVDEAIAAGKIRSKFVPPTREAAQAGGRELDWQPYVMKDGRRALRLYDPNTGIAIDAIGGDTQNVVVVNRDGGARIVAGDLNAALHVADTMSVNNQLLDMKRPMKEAYVRSRIQAVFPGGNFVLMKNAAELNKKFPELAKDRDYDPTNPAFTKNGKVYLVLDNMRNAYEANRMILHEAAIHAGLNKKFSAAEKRKFLRSVGEGALNARIAKNLLARRGAKSIDELSDADVEELFAHTWDRRRTDPSLWQKASHALRDMGRSLHLPLDYNADDLEVMVDSLQRDGKGGEGSVAGSDFDTEDHAQGVPYGMGARDYSGDVADASAPAERSEGGEDARGMQRNDRIRRNHPYTWMYAIRKFDGDEDAAADFVSDLAAKEAQLGVAGETERGMHAVIIGQRLENGEDLLPEDMDVLEENGFTGQVLYRDFGYRRQKNGVWKLTAKPEASAPAQKPVQAPSAPKAAIATETTTTEGEADETGNGADEAPAKPEEGAAGEPEAAEVAKPAEAEPPRAEAPDAGVVEPPAEGAERPVSERSIVEKLTDRAPVQELPVAEVVNDDRRIPNFKEGANPETGEVEPLTGEPYDLVSNPIVVMEFKDGKKVVVTGRHRLAMYRRAGREKIAARVIREADGWTVEDAKAIDAIGNIIDEKGTVKDYVNYFNNARPTRDEARADGFLDRPKGQRAFSIYEGASEDTRAAIDWDGTGGEGLISVEQAGVIAEAAPKQGALQRVLVRRALDGVRGKKLAILARSLADEAKRRGAAPKAEGNTQLDLFTSEEDMALLRLEERRADYRAKRANEYNRIAENLRTALRKGGRLDLNRDYARELGITDPKDKGQVAAARDKAVERANYWENAVRLDEADKAEMDAALGIEREKPTATPAKPDLTLESKTAEELKAEEEKRRQRAEIERRQKAPLKGGTGEVGQTQMDLGDTNGDLFNPVVPNEAPAQKPLTGAPDAAAMERAREAAERHVVSYGNGMKGTLADIIRSGGGRLHPEKGLTTFDKGKPRVVTVGFEQFAPTKDELPHLVQVQREYDAAHPDEVPPRQRGNIRSNGLVAVVSSTDEDVREAMRNQVRKESTKDLERHLATPGYRSEYKQAAREELARRKAEEDAANPADTAPDALPKVSAEAKKAMDEFAALWPDDDGTRWFSREMEEDGATADVLKLRAERPYLQKSNQAASGALSNTGNAGSFPRGATATHAVLQSLDENSISNRPASVKGVFGAIRDLADAAINGRATATLNVPVTARNFISQLWAIGFDRQNDGASVYFQEGKVSTTRASDHSATATFFRSANNLSLVIRRPRNFKRFEADKEKNVVEAVFKEDYLEAHRELLPYILRDLGEFVATGEYHDTAGASAYNYSGSDAFKSQARDRLYFDALARGDMETARRMVREAAEKAMPGAKEVHVDWSMRERDRVKPFTVGSMPKALAREIASWDYVSASPVSDSFYNMPGKTWEHTPDGIIRVSDHWNFRNTRHPGVHCRTDVDVENNEEWVMARYDAKSGVYKVMKRFPYNESRANAVTRTARQMRQADGLLNAQVMDASRISAEAMDEARKNAVAFFDPQTGTLKSLDPVAYDGEGKVIPLSQRFDAKKEDIRWFSREMEGDAIAPDQLSESAASTSRPRRSAVALSRTLAVSGGDSGNIIPIPVAEVKRGIAKFRNGDKGVRTENLPDTLRDLGKIFKLKYAGRSRYATYEARIGNIVLRLSDHNAYGENFLEHEPNAKQYVSVYIDRVTYPEMPTPVAYEEIRYPLAVFESKPDAVVSSIVDGVSDVLDGKPYNIDPSLGEKKEYAPLNPLATSEEAQNLEDPRSESSATEAKDYKPKKTRKMFKLFRKYADGTYGALFIDSANRLVPGEWYKAKSPKIENLRELAGATPEGAFKWGKVYLVDADGKARPVKKMPTSGEVDAATARGERYMTVALGKKDGRKLFYNLGINGSGSVAGYALRPGWHTTNAPSAGHIGKQPLGKDGKVAATGQNHYRRSDEVWCEVEIPDDADYNKAALARASFLKEKGRETEKNRKEAQLDYIPVGGSYFYRTNSNADEKQDWVITGAIKIVRELPREEVNRFNRENGFSPDAPIADTREEAAAKQNATPDDARWFSRSLEDVDEELETKRFNAMLKIAKAYIKDDVATFGDLARNLAAYYPGKFKAMREGGLREIWNYAAGRLDLEEVSKADAETIYRDIDAKAAQKPQERDEQSLLEADDSVEIVGHPDYDGESGVVDDVNGNRVSITLTMSGKRITVSREYVRKDQQKPESRGEATSIAADKIISRLISQGKKFSRRDVEDIVGEVLGGSVSEGTFEMKDVTDIMELAVNRYIMQRFKRGAQFTPNHKQDDYSRIDDGTGKLRHRTPVEYALLDIEGLRDVLSVLPTQTTRSAEQDKMQQFSTPPHEAYAAAWVANITDKDVMLEPSAGIGGIAVFAKNAGAKVILNELSPRRREILAQLGLSDRVYDFNAEHLWAHFYPLVMGRGATVPRPTVVVMNPPFLNSALTSRKDTVGVGGKHVEEALDMLAPGGRLVAIVGHGMAHDAESPKVRAWWRKIGEKYSVRADVTVNGEEYAKYGTTYDNDIIVIDKVAPKAGAAAPVYGIINSIDELPAMLEEVRNDRPAIQTARNVSGNEKSPSQQGVGADTRQNGQVGDGRGARNAQTDASRSDNARTATGNGVRGNGGVETLSPAASGRRGVGRMGGPSRIAGDTGASEQAGELADVSNVADNAGRGAAAGQRGQEKGGASASGAGRDAGLRGLQDGGGRGVNGDVSAVQLQRPVDGLVKAKEVGDGTFSEYQPSKVRIAGAKPHPTPLVESSAMTAVLPPDPTYKPILPQKAIESGKPSDAQLETVVYAGQAHEQKLADGRRKGYAIGDGTGVGKGTEISAIISDNWNHGRKKAIWITEKAALLNDAKRDLGAFGLDKEIFEFDPKKKSATGRPQGVGFTTYKSLASDVVYDSNGNVQSRKRGQTTRFQEIVKWLGKDFDGVIVFDEAHNAANSMSVKKKRGKSDPTAKALAVVALQKAMPNARILYVSATMATEVHNLAFAERLGLWGEGTAFRDRESFISQISSGGLSVMEIVARDMKSLGVYMARSLSYEGVGNRRLEHKLSPDQKRKYNEFADAWQMVFSRVQDALVATNRAANGQSTSHVMSALYGAEQRFYEQVLSAMQMPSVIADARKQLAAGHSVVFQLVKTNEAAQENAVKKQRTQNNGKVNVEDLDLSPREILINYVQKSFPTEQFAPEEDEDGHVQYVMLKDANDNPIENPAAVEAREELLDKLRMMKMEGSPLDTIIEEFGPDNVAEITGRRRRREAMRDENGETVMRFVNRSKGKGLVETDEFNAGKRRVLVFSDAGGTGRSFHADRTYGNTQKRIHYLVQAGWKADKALQGMGRTHRSNEAQPPEYVLVSTDLRGHQRFITTVARRLAQLGSLTAGDRSTAGGGVFSEEDNLENRYALNSVHDLLEGIYKSDRARFNDICRQLGFVRPKMDKRTGEVTYVNKFIDEEDNTLDLSSLDVPTFLNRILNLRVDDQNRLFDEFTDIMRESIELAKENGTFDPGLEKLQGHKIEELNRTELWNAGQGTGSTDIVEVGVSKKSRKMPFDTARMRMERLAEGRDWTFARNVRSGKVFGVVSLAKTKTDASGVVHDQIRCFFPDGTTATLNADDVRFTGERQNSERLSEKSAAEEWQKALDAIPELDTAKRYFVTGTLLPVWDRLGVQNPRIYRIAPTGGNSSFLGMEVKADRVNDVLRRFGKTPQAVELTPEMVLNRIVKDGKKVPLLQSGWELKRARVNGDWRVELTGPEDRKTLEKLAAEGLGTYERIGYTPRFFVPRTVEGLQTFLAAYPAMPEDGGIANAAQSGEDYSSLDYAGRQRKFAELFDRFQHTVNINGDEVETAERSLAELILSMPTDELRRIHDDFRQHEAEYHVREMRQMVRRELESRGEKPEQGAMWFSRDIEGDDGWDPLSAIAIHEVNAWRAARGLPEMPKSPRTSVESVVKAGKHMASNEDEMRRFVEVSARTPQNWTAVEVNAVAQRRLALERDYDEKTRLIEVAEMNGNREEARRIREARDEVERFIDVMDSAINKAKREWGLSGLARRFMLNRDGTFARFTGELRSVVGRALTEDEERGARALWDAYRAAQGTLDEATVAKTAELLKDIVKEHMRREEQAHRQGGAAALAEVERDYQHALDHIRVHANRAGGVLIGLPNGRRWIDAIRRFHMAAALETGRGLTVDEMLAKIHEDIDGMVRADDHDIMQIITGHGNTYEADNSELEKALREQRRLMNEYQKWEDMMDEGHLPDKTGLIRDEPTQTEREAQRRTREMMREFMQEHPELMQMDASRRLKTMQDALMKRWKNEIEDLRKAIDEGERIMRQKNTMTYTPEMEEMRRELEQMRQQYREAFPPEPLTHEQRVARVTRVLQARLAKLEEKRAALEGAGTDAERAAILAKAKGEKVEDAALDALRARIEEVKEDIEDMKTLAFPEGTPEEFAAMVSRRRKALDRNIARIQALLANRDFAPQKREPSALAKRVAADPDIVAKTKARDAAARKLVQERERFRRSTLPYNAGRALDWFETLAAVPRVFRTMLDLSATMTQGAALFAAHPVLGYRALADSVRAFYSEENSDAIMAAMLADPDFEEFQRMGGHIYTVSDIGERGVPEEFRGVATKLVTVNGREYGLEDVPGVKASERSFGTFLNSINLSVYKAIKASGGWGPTGPSEAQKRDIALSLNVASGRGYENKGARGAWERLASAALWAPRFAVSGFKMATGWNVLAPHFTGLTTERSYGDRWVSSKVAAKEYARQLAAMAAWTLVATLLMGRRDPEWLDEVTDPRSSNFLNVRVGNTNLNFFGPIKQWWTFMARILTGKTRGADGVVRRRDQGQTAARFARGKLSPLFGLGVDLVKQKDFLGNKLVWEGEPDEKNREKGGYSHVAVSLGVPLSAGDVFEAFRENSLANALMLTPFIVAGAAKSTYALDERERAVAPYNAAAKEYAAALKEGRHEDARRLREENPALRDYARIEALKRAAANTKRYIGAMEKEGKRPSKDTLALYERQQQAVFDAITAARRRPPQPPPGR